MGWEETNWWDPIFGCVNSSTHVSFYVKSYGSGHKNTLMYDGYHQMKGKKRNDDFVFLSYAYFMYWNTFVNANFRLIFCIFLHVSHISYKHWLMYVFLCILCFVLPIWCFCLLKLSKCLVSDQSSFPSPFPSIRLEIKLTKWWIYK